MSVMEPETLARLLDDHGAALVLYARQWCAVPEDIVQEAFVKLAGQRPTPAYPVGWLYRVVRNGAVSAARSERRRVRHESQAAARSPVWFMPSESGGLDAETVGQALASLPIEQREVIVAHIWGRQTFEQIAQLTGVSSSTVHRTYIAGLTALRERLGVACPKNPVRPS